MRGKLYIELERDEVNRRALRLWRAAGRPPGRRLEYWLEAEVELLAEQMGRRIEADTFAEAA